MNDAFWKDPAGLTHRVTIVARGTRTATIEYWDNSHRGDRFKVGRRYNHGTRKRVVVYLKELREA